MTTNERLANRKFAEMRTRQAEVEKELAELRAWKERDQRVQVAYAMAKETELDEHWTKIMLSFARNQDGDLKAFLTDVLAATESE